MLGLGACHPPPPAPLPVRALGGSAPCAGLQGAPAAAVQALFVQPAALGALSPEAEAVALFDTVGLTTDDGRMLYTDLPHGNPGSQVFSHCKLDLSSLSLRPIAGQLDGAQRFTPSRDVLQSLDSGFGAVVRAGDIVERVVFAPWYESRAYLPFDRAAAPTPGQPRGATGASGGRAPDGRAGAPGTAGEDGAPGARGASGAAPGESGGAGGRGGDGGQGQSGAPGAAEGDRGGAGQTGGDGGRGGRGGSGATGGPGEEGGPGQAGENGPQLDVLVKPLRSPFYPGERLVYVEVQAVWSGRQGRQEERRNYILHEGERFRLRSEGAAGGRGGDGGQGGAGGAGGPGGGGGHGGDGGQGGAAGGAVPTGSGGPGGDGGDAGAGGDGGRGAPGGCGGSGGAGGRGGDGGRIRVELRGPPDFRAVARRSLRFESVPGAGGSGGQAGLAGGTGLPGAGGLAGSPGLGGSGGTGTTLGARGVDGRSAPSGEPGPRSTPLTCRSRPGAGGPPGNTLPVRILEGA
jgi:hypothetical protein